MKNTEQEIIDLGFTPSMFGKQPDSEVLGTDGLNYVCIQTHTSATENKPVTGANYADFWFQAGESGIAWVTATAYRSGFYSLISSVLSAQSLLFQGRIGATAYASAASPQKDQVKRAEACLTAAELLRRRINILLGNVTGAAQGEIKADNEFRQRNDYLKEADELINKIVSSITTDPASSSSFASGALVTDHFS